MTAWPSATAFSLFAHDALETVRDGTGWQVEYPRNGVEPPIYRFAGGRRLPGWMPVVNKSLETVAWAKPAKWTTWG